MIVNRRTFIVKAGYMDQLLALMKAAKEQFSTSAHAWRSYAPEIGPIDVVAFEWEYGSLEEYEKDWAEWGATPESAAFMEKWNQLTESGGSNEIWRLVE
jgi:hypothetical protein